MGGNPLKTNQAALGLLFIGLILATALTGTAPIGYHEECINGADDDADTAVDGLDQECFNYPFADGNGESNTVVADRYNGNAYASLFEYHLAYGGDVQQTTDGICFALATGMYGPDDTEAAGMWIDENQIDCGGAGP